MAKRRTLNISKALLLKFLAVIMAAELSVMMMIYALRLDEKLSPALIAVIDPVALGVILTVVLGFQFILPLQRRQEEHEQIQHDWEEIFNTVSDIITIHDSDFNIIHANKAAQEALKLPMPGGGTKCYTRYHGTDGPPEGCPSCLCRQSGQPSMSEVYEPHLQKHIEIRALPRLNGNGEVAGLVHIVRDISERKRMEKKLAESERHLRAVIEAEPECVKLLARDGSLLEMNPAGLAMIEADSLDQVRGKQLIGLVAPEHRAPFASLMESVFRGETGSLEFQITGFKGARRWLETRAVPLRDSDGAIAALLSVTRDITEHKALEGQLRHAQKMEAIGTLTSGIAHDFNNVLTAIIGYANVIKMKLAADDPLRSCALQILAATERAAGMTQSLLTFGKKQHVTLKPVNLNAVISRSLGVLRGLLREAVTLTADLSRDELIVPADPGQIERVLMNLASNARDAMPGGGSVRIATGVTELGDDFIRGHGYGKKGRYAVITFSDTGTGMDEQTRKRAFEPFFTTKETGKGVGLGLAIVYGVIKQHKGFITVYSEPGTGTAFKTYLPLAGAGAPDRATPSPPVPEGGGETVLVAEDDADARRTSTSLLEQFGYTVVEAGNGADAVRLFREHRDAISLVMLDAVMPDKTGRETYEEIVKIKPGVKALFTSGYPSDFVQGKGLVGSGMPFVSKPISPRELLNKIREVIES